MFQGSIKLMFMTCCKVINPFVYVSTATLCYNVCGNKRPLTKGHSGLIWELQASVSANGFQGHISPEEIKEVAAEITEGEAGLTPYSDQQLFTALKS